MSEDLCESVAYKHKFNLILTRPGNHVNSVMNVESKALTVTRTNVLFQSLRSTPNSLYTCKEVALIQVSYWTRFCPWPLACLSRSLVHDQAQLVCILLLIGPYTVVFDSKSKLLGVDSQHSEVAMHGADLTTVTKAKLQIHQTIPTRVFIPYMRFMISLLCT
jgi:hypothetical protein